MRYNAWREPASVLRAKQAPDARWLAESVNKPCVAVDCGQKKAPSPWITFLVLGILGRVDAGSG